MTGNHSSMTGLKTRLEGQLVAWPPPQCPSRHNLQDQAGGAAGGMPHHHSERLDTISKLHDRSEDQAGGAAGGMPHHHSARLNTISKAGGAAGGMPHHHSERLDTISKAGGAAGGMPHHHSARLDTISKVGDLAQLKTAGNTMHALLHINYSYMTGNHSSMTGLKTRLEGQLVAYPITTVPVSTQSPRWVTWLN
ncbi:hypothetical protein NADE_003646 [Nannochloris sp. 'desiccata']|nr:hypothetical protein NADE_003646 [Chlorella desiccata (nom. nud.)]